MPTATDTTANYDTDLLQSDDWRVRASVMGWNETGEARGPYAIPYTVGWHAHGFDIHVKHGGSGQTLLQLSPREAQELATALMVAASQMTPPRR